MNGSTITMLEGRPTSVTLLPSYRSVCFLQYTNFVLQVRNVVNKTMDRTYENLLLDVVTHESDQNDHSYVRELSGFTFGSQRQILAWWAVAQKTLEKHKTISKLKGGCFPRTIR